MNQGKIWLVVKPSVGLPLMLGAVAITALLVHTAVLKTSTWFPAFIEGGKAKAVVSAPATTAAPAAAQPAKK